MSSQLESWLKLEEIFSPNWGNMKDIDPREEVDWELLQQISLGSTVAAGCALMEQAGLKGSSNHIRVIFELRNAFIHNECDISKNRNLSAFTDAQNYLENHEFDNLFKPIDRHPFLVLQGNKVIFKPNIIGAIRNCLL